MSERSREEREAARLERERRRAERDGKVLPADSSPANQSAPDDADAVRASDASGAQPFAPGERGDDEGRDVLGDSNGDGFDDAELDELDELDGSRSSTTSMSRSRSSSTTRSRSSRSPLTSTRFPPERAGSRTPIALARSPGVPYGRAARRAASGAALPIAPRSSRTSPAPGGAGS